MSHQLNSIGDLESEIFEEQNNTELQLRIEQANRRLGDIPETTRQITGAPGKLTRVSWKPLSFPNPSIKWIPYTKIIS